MDKQECPPSGLAASKAMMKILKMKSLTQATGKKIMMAVYGGQMEGAVGGWRAVGNEGVGGEMRCAAARGPKHRAGAAGHGKFGGKENMAEGARFGEGNWAVLGGIGLRQQGSGKGIGRS